MYRFSTEKATGGKPDKWHTELLELALSLHQTLHVEEVLTTLQHRLGDFFHVESVRLFSVDPAAGEIFTKVPFNDVLVEIRFPISSQSVAGYTALVRKTVTLNDVRNPDELAKYPEIRYDDRWEKKTGLVIRSIHSMPLLRTGGELQGIFQLINWDRAYPDPVEDDAFLTTLAKLVAESLFHKNQALRRTTRFDLLLERSVIGPAELQQAIAHAREHRGDALDGDAVSVLVERMGVSAEVMGESLARHFLRDFHLYDDAQVLSIDLFHGINKNYLRRNFVVPIARGEDTVTIVMDDPSRERIVREVKEATGVQHCKILVGLRKDILRLIDGAVAATAPPPDFTDLLAELPENAGETAVSSEESILDENAPAIVRAVNRIILEAFDQGVSDIHVEPAGGNVPAAIRFRRDGVCFPYSEIPASHVNALINRIKIMAQVKLDERRFPQSGKIKVKYGNTDIELRVEVTPTVGGNQDIVMRILASGKPLSLEALNLSADNQTQLERIIAQPYGLVLVVGPTGSGKTTTLHAVMGRLNTPERKIWTAEDPVEITQRGLRQVQINPNIKPVPFDFPLAMRSFLRADPDVIMVGEMRDRETAAIAIEASLTGHLVLSTLHTNSAPETVTRLVEMDIDPINLADAMLGVLAQRLLRLLCRGCKTAWKPEEPEGEKALATCRKLLPEAFGTGEAERVSIQRRIGCLTCGHTGYRGRTGIHELLLGSPNVRRMIGDRAHAEDIRKQALAEGMRTLKMDGIAKVLRGQMDLAEVLRVCID